MCDIATDSDDATIISAMIGMGNSLNKRVTAEGVETLEQLTFLQAARCGEGQGYYFSRPVVAEEYTELLRMGLSEPPRTPNNSVHIPHV